MHPERSHRAISADGTEVAGRVHGDGLPLVLVHGGLEDGELSWSALRPQLTDRYSCCTVSTRGRDLSGQHPDHTFPRLVEDVVAYADSLGAPVGPVGHSSGAGLALAAAAQASAMTAVAAYEPAVPAAINEDDVARIGAGMERLAEAAGQHRHADAARILFEVSPIATDDEVPAMAVLGQFEAMARYVPITLQELGQAAASQQPDSSDPAVLGRIAAPVLRLHGTATGAAHFGPLLAPEAVATEPLRFFHRAEQHPADAGPA